MNVFSYITMIVILVGRFISGVHWFTDILGGILISISLLMIYYTLISLIKKEQNK